LAEGIEKYFFEGGVLLPGNNHSVVY
jgi:hypothetical protein